jgi:signal transduction histidine kinase
MSYRSVKKVLGETNLERKCRVLFGLSLLALISVSFWFYGKRTTQLIEEKNRDTGRRLVDSALLKYHWLKWETSERERQDVADYSRSLENLDYDWHVIDFQPPPDPDDKIVPPGDAWERENLPILKALLQENLLEYEEELRQYREQRAQYEEAKEELKKEPAGEDAVAPSPLEISPPSPPEFLPPSLARTVDGKTVDGKDQREYHYFQPVVWKKTCTVGCHRDLGGADAFLPTAPDFLPQEKMPFRVVRVVVPYESTSKAIAANTAILWATAIFTFGVAMFFLWAVVKYVIVKPLKHLREVSDEISRGNTSLRADIHTNDEFEDLADSFNRMLRHLVDAQEDLRRANADLDGKVDELAQVNMQLYEMNRLKSDFLATMSHELRTPLNSIIGFSDVLKEIETLNTRQRRYVQNIQKSGRDLLEMINDILDLAKMESGTVEIRPSEFHIEAVVSAQCDMVLSLTEEKNIDLNVHIEPELPTLFQDQNKVQQILNNLLSNAIKFTPEGGRIDVSARRNERGMLELTVADTGVGIAEEDREVIFEKFRQSVARHSGGDNLTREYSGTGLGLSIVRELCKLLGGEIDFVSELGKGSKFFVMLPWSIAEHTAARAAAAVPKKAGLLTKPRRADWASAPVAHVAAGATPDEPAEI